LTAIWDVWAGQQEQGTRAVMATEGAKAVEDAHHMMPKGTLMVV